MFRNRTTSVGLSGMFVLVLFMAGLAFGVQQDTLQTLAQQAGSAMPPSSSQPTATKPEEKKKNTATNFVEVTEQGGWVMYPIYGVFVLGLGVVMFQFVKIFFDTHYAKPIKTTIEKKLGAESGSAEERIKEIWQLVQQYPKSKMAQLLDKLCDLWHRDSSAEALQLEIDGYMSSVKERYEIGRNFAILLSDTAGALGLLGTVLGMYETFMPGQLESTQIISGMGVALVTTIGGLIVSIFLNFAISWAHSAFHSHLEGVTEHADAFRNRFGKGQAAAGGVVQIKEVVHVAAAGGDQPIIAPPPAPEPPKVRRVPSKLKILSGNNQVAEAGASLPKALEVAVEDQFGDPLKNLTVIFETNGSMITFDNGENVKQVDTDFIGRAKTHARFGRLIGKHKILARINGEANLLEEFEVESRPGAPEKLHVLSGHLQTGHPGAPLSEPLSLKLEDAFGNPIPEQPVVFEVAYNSGRLDRDKTRAEVNTDDDGVASIGFRLAETPGANIVKAAVKSKGSRKLETSFESMGRE
jgi:biopolymer transport protein ExbB/TolQ